MLELSVNMLGFVWFEGDTVAAVHRHPQDRRKISLAGTSCTSGVVSGRNAASMAQRAICASSKPSDDLSSSLFLRFDFEWSNFATAITDGGILKAIVNSVIITLCSTVITCLVGAAAAYPLARRQTRGNKLVSAGILAIMMIPPLSILVPLYSFLVQIGGVNSYWGIVLVLSTTNLPLAIFLYTAFIRATHRCWRSMRWDCTVAPRCGGTVSYPTMAMWPPDWTGHPDSSWITSRRSTAAG